MLSAPPRRPNGYGWLIASAVLFLTAVCLGKCSGIEYNVTVTAYSPGRQLDGVTTGETTSTGTLTISRGIATDHLQFPVGTRITVPGYGVAVVDDACGAARSARRRGNPPLIDIRLPTVALARAWGRQHLHIIVEFP